MANGISFEPGTRFGHLTVIGQAPNGKHNHRQWFCRCDCGQECLYTTSKLTSGDAKSCRCKQYAHREGSVTRNHLQYLYQAWSDMKQRCYNTNNAAFHHYGGRGITVCEGWRNNFKQFFLDMGERPSKEYSLDRVDNNQGYSKGNCKWSTWSEQMLNRRSYKHK